MGSAIDRCLSLATGDVDRVFGRCPLEFFGLFPFNKRHASVRMDHTGYLLRSELGFDHLLRAEKRDGGEDEQGDAKLLSGLRASRQNSSGATSRRAAMNTRLSS